MTLISGLLWGGVVLTVIGLIMLAWCIWRALAIRSLEDKDEATKQFQTLAAVNMGAVGIAGIGLGCVVMANIF